MNENASGNPCSRCPYSPASAILTTFAVNTLFYPNYSQGVENMLAPMQNFSSIFRATYNQHGFAGLYQGWLFKMAYDKAHHYIRATTHKEMCSKLIADESYKIQCPLMNHVDFKPAVSGKEICCIIGSGLVATMLLQPLNVIFYNTVAKRTMPTMEVIRQLFKIRGATCFMRGLFPALCQSLIGSLVYIFLAPAVQKLVNDSFCHKPNRQKLNVALTEFVCALVSTFLSSPFHFAQALLSTHTHFRNTFDCWSQMVTTTNSWSCLWSGFTGTILYRIPNEMLLFFLL